MKLRQSDRLGLRSKRSDRVFDLIGLLGPPRFSPDSGEIQLRAPQVRRLPVLTRDKRLVGIIALSGICHTGDSHAEVSAAALSSISTPSASTCRDEVISRAQRSAKPARRNTSMAGRPAGSMNAEKIAFRDRFRAKEVELAITSSTWRCMGRPSRSGSPRPSAVSTGVGVGLPSRTTATGKVAQLR
jgi:hypothetical protein